MSPVEHLKLLRRTLIDSDNLLGSRHVIPAVHGQVQVIQQLRARCSGADRRALLVMQAQFAEFAGWLHQDSSDFRAAQFWLDRALEWSHAAGDGEMATYVMARKSQLAGDMGSAAEAIDLADAAGTMARSGSRLRATAATYGAHGYALGGQATPCLRAIDGARELADRLDDDPKCPWATWLDDAYIEVQRGRCLSVLGEHEQAAVVFQQAIRELPPSFRRDRGVYLAREALAHAEARDPAQAADVGMQALVIAHDTQSGRIVDELARVDSRLTPWATLPAVADFRDAMTSVIPSERTS
jgi:tetratricopeptide (TPR) repeat protein